MLLSKKFFLIFTSKRPPSSPAACNVPFANAFKCSASPERSGYCSTYHYQHKDDQLTYHAPARPVPVAGIDGSHRYTRER